MAPAPTKSMNSANSRGKSDCTSEIRHSVSRVRGWDEASDAPAPIPDKGEPGTLTRICPLPTARYPACARATPLEPWRYLPLGVAKVARSRSFSIDGGNLPRVSGRSEVIRKLRPTRNLRTSSSFCNLYPRRRRQPRTRGPVSVRKSLACPECCLQDSPQPFRRLQPELFLASILRPSIHDNIFLSWI